MTNKTTIAEAIASEKVLMNQLFDQYKTNTESSFPSIYSKDDVVKLINDLQDYMGNMFDLMGQQIPEMVKEDTSQIDITKVLDCISSVCDNLTQDDVCDIDLDSAEFSMDYRNTIELERVDVNVNTDEIYTQIADALNTTFATTNVESPQ
jgi:hypothetical protein